MPRMASAPVNARSTACTRPTSGCFVPIWNDTCAMQPTETGLPMELYFFTDTVVWVDYERIQSDVFDHVLAVIPEFDLRVFQNPSGSDIEALRYQRPEPDVPAKPDVTEKSSASPE